MNRLKIAALTAAALCGAGLLATTSFAHGSMKPMHGGKVQMSGETLFEIVKGPKGVDVYISEEDEPLPGQGLHRQADRHRRHPEDHQPAGGYRCQQVQRRRAQAGGRGQGRRLAGRNGQRHQDLRDLHALKAPHTRTLP
ncbi:hypothetical protein ACFSTD_22755 [Novosphingobium colocasiae]